MTYQYNIQTVSNYKLVVGTKSMFIFKRNSYQVKYMSM